eukprot:Plantae.Rhodophyta-Purpureofilum_apyrenoidigerum.ctg4196.p1 GENE.Plantae.Rhodophyta-Purpureofilum_apyrenoidigerum.ctg4196~~Plantae.Rhodophyta-Purpureofilum_apyrenoidigerum.ctg4196.p1  ORF type:complete len:690 (-),score=152.96 Plantae.Rhodophyta-Purpureofilum_apyrenoidigerum.ctg4196:192-2261(-)
MHYGGKKPNLADGAIQEDIRKMFEVASAAGMAKLEGLKPGSEKRFALDNALWKNVSSFLRCLRLNLESLGHTLYWNEKKELSEEKVEMAQKALEDAVDTIAGRLGVDRAASHLDNSSNVPSPSSKKPEFQFDERIDRLVYDVCVARMEHLYDRNQLAQRPKKASKELSSWLSEMRKRRFHGFEVSEKALGDAFRRVEAVVEAEKQRKRRTEKEEKRKRREEEVQKQRTRIAEKQKRALERAVKAAEKEEERKRKAVDLVVQSSKAAIADEPPLKKQKTGEKTSERHTTNAASANAVNPATANNEAVAQDADRAKMNATVHQERQGVNVVRVSDAVETSKSAATTKVSTCEKARTLAVKSDKVVVKSVSGSKGSTEMVSAKKHSTTGQSQSTGRFLATGKVGAEGKHKGETKAGAPVKFSSTVKSSIAGKLNSVGKSSPLVRGATVSKVSVGLQSTLAVSKPVVTVRQVKSSKAGSDNKVAGSVKTSKSLKGAAAGRHVPSGRLKNSHPAVLKAVSTLSRKAHDHSDDSVSCKKMNTGHTNASAAKIHPDKPKSTSAAKPKDRGSGAAVHKSQPKQKKAEPGKPSKGAIALAFSKVASKKQNRPELSNTVAAKRKSDVLDGSNEPNIPDRGASTTLTKTPRDAAVHKKRKLSSAGKGSDASSKTQALQKGDDASTSISAQDTPTGFISTK